MDRLKGKTILVGKEPGQGRLCVSVLVNGQPKMALIGQAGSVPNSVSRCKPAVGMAHCKIEIDQLGNMTLTNLKPQNVTFVDGMEIVSKRITVSNAVALGKDKYSIDLNIILNTVLKMFGLKDLPTGSKSGESLQSSIPEYSIRHLKDIWADYEETLEAIQRRQQKIGKRRMLPIMIGSASGLAAPLFATIAIPTLYITVPIAAISFLIYMKNYGEKDTTIEDRKRANDRFIDNYICPNPKCHHFMGNQPYKILRQNKKCPYCGCFITEK